MDKEKLKEANKLNDRIEKLSLMKRDLNPEYCNGVAFSKIYNTNFDDKKYYHHLFATTPDSKEDKAVIMKHAIQSMYDKVCLLLEEAESDLKKL